MRIVLPEIGNVFSGPQLRELVRTIKDAFSKVVEDNRRGAIVVTVDYELAKEDSLVLVAPVAAGTVNIAIPAVAQWMIDQKWQWSVKLTAAGTLNLVPVSGTIDGAASASTSVIQTAMTARATSDGWKLI
jgi:ribonuclease PH